MQNHKDFTVYSIFCQTQIYEGSCFVGNPLEGPGLGEPAQAPFLLRMSCADLASEALSVRLGFFTKHWGIC